MAHVDTGSGSSGCLGLLVNRPRHGYYVTEFSEAQIIDLSDFKCWLDRALVDDLATHASSELLAGIASDVEDLSRYEDRQQFNKGLLAFRNRFLGQVHNVLLAEQLRATYQKLFILTALVDAYDEDARKRRIIDTQQRFWTAMAAADHQAALETALQDNRYWQQNVAQHIALWRAELTRKQRMEYREDIHMTEKIERPTLLFALLPILCTMGLLIWLIVFKGGAPHMAIMSGIILTAIWGRVSGFSWDEMLNGMIAAASQILPVVGVAMTIGMLIGAWIISGTVPYLMLLGYDLINPGLFLPAVVIACSLVSLATGTSWGTLGTIGISFMGIGEVLGIPFYITAGAIVSSTFFGDKISPLSNTTNFCANIAGADLYRISKT